MNIPQKYGCSARSFLIGLVSVCVAAVGSPASAEPDGRFVNTDNGPVRGVMTPATVNFLGIPYAAAPVGDLRWKPPQPHARWRTPLDATTHPARAAPSGTDAPLEDASDMVLEQEVHHLAMASCGASIAIAEVLDGLRA